MGQKIVKLYEFINANGGLPAKMRVAVITLIPSNKAADVADTPDAIAKVRAAIKEVTGKDAPNV